MIRSMLLFSAIFGTATLSAQPVITEQPNDRTTCPGECPTFAVTAVGGGLSYQWLEVDAGDSTDIAGETMMSIEYCVELAQSGIGVACRVTDSNGLSVVSDAAIITVDSCLPPVADFVWEWNHLELCFTNTSQRATDVFWLFGDGTTNQDNVDPICHTYGTKEIYYVKLQAFNDHGSDAVEKVVDLLDVEDVSSSSWSLFPNPSFGSVTVNSTDRIDRLKVMDMSGRLVFSKGLLTKHYTLNTSSIDPGVYIITIDIDGRTHSERLLLR